MTGVVASNPRAVSGGNQPADEPPFTAEWSALDERIRALTANASQWLNAVPEITTAEQARDAGGFRKQLVAARNKAERAGTEEMRPYKATAEVIGKRYAALRQTCSICIDLLDPKIDAWLKAEEARQAAERQAAEAKAREAAAAAERAIAEARTTLAKAERGELAGSRVNTAGQVAEAERLRAEAAAAQRQVERLEGARPIIAGEFASGGSAKGISRAIVRYDYEITDIAAVLAAAFDEGAPELTEAAMGWVRRKHSENRDWAHAGVTITPVLAPR